MEAMITDLYQKIFFHQSPFWDAVVNVVIILVLASIAWWIFNKILKMVKKRGIERAFFQKNEDIFILIRKAGHYTIVILVGVSLNNLANLPHVEKVFFALMILLIASFINVFIRNLLPRLQETVVSKTKNKVDDVIFDLLRKFASVIIFITAGILALDVLGLN